MGLNMKKSNILYKKQNRITLQNDHRGMTMVEIIVVVAIMIILAGGMVWGMSAQQSANVKDAAQKTESTLEDVRMNTLAMEGPWTYRIYNDGGTCEVSILKSGSSIKTKKLGSKVTVSVDTGSGLQTLADGMAVDITFATGSGVVSSVGIGAPGAQTPVSLTANASARISLSGGSSTIDLTLWYLTGKITR